MHPRLDRRFGDRTRLQEPIRERVGSLIPCLTTLLSLSSNTTRRVSDKECTLGGITQILILFTTSTRTSCFPNLSSLLRRYGWLHLILWHPIDARCYTRNADLIAEIIGDGLTPLLEFVWCELELVILMTKYSVRAAGWVRKSRTGAEILAKVVVKAVVGCGDENDAWTVLAEYGRSELLEC